MAVNRIFTFNTIGPGQTVSLFVHGYSNRDAANYSVVIYNQFTPGVPNPQAHVMLTQGETFRWSVDGTIGRKIYIQNIDLFGSVGVDVLEMKESF